MFLRIKVCNVILDPSHNCLPQLHVIGGNTKGVYRVYALGNTLMWCTGNNTVLYLSSLQPSLCAYGAAKWPACRIPYQEPQGYNYII